MGRLDEDKVSKQVRMSNPSKLVYLGNSGTDTDTAEDTQTPLEQTAVHAEVGSGKSDDASYAHMEQDESEATKVHGE